MRLPAWLCLAGALNAHAQMVGQLRPEAARDFAAYQATADQEVQQRWDGRRAFLWIDEHPEEKRRAEAGEIVTYAFTGDDGQSVAGGLIHDWVGDLFLRGVALEAVRNFLVNTDRHTSAYSEVKQARVLSRDGNRSVTMLRLVKKKYLTVVLDIEYRNEWQQPAPDRWVMSSRSQKVQEVQNAGTPQENKLPPDTGHGFLWRMNSEWSLRQEAGGVWVELRSVTLTRDSPRGLGWIVRPLIRNLPGDTILATLSATQRALKK